MASKEELNRHLQQLEQKFQQILTERNGWAAASNALTARLEQQAKGHAAERSLLLGQIERLQRRLASRRNGRLRRAWLRLRNRLRGRGMPAA